MDIIQQCEACSNTNLCFVHILEHEEDKRLISVGIECAGDLLEDWYLPPTGRERDQKERAVAHPLREARPGALPLMPTWKRRGNYELPARCIAKRTPRIPGDAG